MNETSSVDQRLQRLRAATSTLVASSGFVDRVMSSLGGAELAWWQILSRPARWVLPAAALLALMAAGFAYQARNALDESLAVGFGAESYSTLEDEP
jgi:ABC-type dipeptide/oligopeptide/nickel transport system permease component